MSRWQSPLKPAHSCFAHQRCFRYHFQVLAEHNEVAAGAAIIEMDEPCSTLSLLAYAQSPDFVGPFAQCRADMRQGHRADCYGAFSLLPSTTKKRGMRFRSTWRLCACHTSRRTSSFRGTIRLCSRPAAVARRAVGRASRGTSRLTLCSSSTASSCTTGGSLANNRQAIPLCCPMPRLIMRATVLVVLYNMPQKGTY